MNPTSARSLSLRRSRKSICERIAAPCHEITRTRVTFLLGLNAYHADSSACLVSDGVLIAAAEEERFRRIKHWAGFPSEAIRYCLSEAGIRMF